METGLPPTNFLSPETTMLLKWTEVREEGGEKEGRVGCVTVNTVEPLNKGHFGANNFVPCREVVPISEVATVLAWCRNKCPLYIERLTLSQRVPTLVAINFPMLL